MSKSANYPNFFMMGAAKAGTTSMWYYLEQHPEIYFPKKVEHKEPCYFCPIHNHRVKELNEYLELYRDVENEKIIGDGSGPYLTYPESPKLIREIIKEPKILIMLRNPVDRAFSLYNFMVYHGYEYINSFGLALKAENKRIKCERFYRKNYEYFYNYLYFNSGLYSQQLERVFKYFGKDNVKVVLFDDLRKSSIDIVQSVYKFLEVENTFVPELSTLNERQYINFPSLNHFEKYQLDRYCQRLRVPAVLKDGARHMIRKIVNSTVIRKQELSCELRAQLNEKYKIDIEKTSRLIDRDLSFWHFNCT